MLDIKEIEEEIMKLEECNCTTYDVCRKLAILYIVRDHYNKQTDPGLSYYTNTFANKPQPIQQATPAPVRKPTTIASTIPPQKSTVAPVAPKAQPSPQLQGLYNYRQNLAREQAYANQAWQAKFVPGWYKKRTADLTNRTQQVQRQIYSLENPTR